MSTFAIKPIRIILNTTNYKPNNKVIFKKGCLNTVPIEVILNDRGGMLTIPAGTIGYIKMLKPDNEEVNNPVASIVNSVITFDMDEKMQAVPGIAQCELILMNGEEVYTSVTFPMEIQDSVFGDRNIQSTSEYKTILNALVAVNAAGEVAQTAYSIASEAETILIDVNAILAQAETDYDKFVTDSGAAISAANTAANNANDKATLADQKATFANEKGTLADQKATAAQSAATNAENKIVDVETRFNALTSSQQQDSEVIDARKGKVSLKAKVDDFDLQLAIERERLNLIEANPGSTSGDLALNDIKVAFNGTVYGSPADAVRGQIGEVAGSIGFVYSDEPDTNLSAYKTISPGYIASSGAISGQSSSTDLSVVFYAVKKGVKYILHGKSVGLSSAYPIAGFTTNKDLSYAGTCTIVLSYSGTITDYNEVYTPSEDGYIIIAKYIYYNALSIANAKVATDLITVKADIDMVKSEINTLEYDRIKDTDLTGTAYSGYYLNTGNTIKTIADTAFKVTIYQVTKNSTYKLYATGARINASLPMVGFGINAIGSNVLYTETIINGSTTPTNYDMEYTPTSDGYIFVASYNMNTQVLVASTKIDSVRITNIENALKQNGTLKIQIFGDSITDNLWGDLTTWANLITTYIPERTITVVNCAVGGGGIGHGKSTTTPSQQDKTYNYVYDLVTDGVTLDTAANVIVILVGTNDWAAGVMNIGAFGDTGYTTLYGSLKGIIEYISTNTSAKLIICTIPQRYNSVDQSRSINAKGEPINDKGYSLRDFCKPFIEMCEFYGIPCIDLNKDLGWNRKNISKFSSDSLHPNTEGDKWIARFICNEIKRHMVTI